MRDPDRLYGIGELAEITGISRAALRFYEEKGLLTPEKRDENNNYRYYSEQQVIEALVIREMKQHGFSLSEMQVLLREGDLHAFRESLGKKVLAQSAQIRQLQERLLHTQKTLKLVDESLGLCDPGQTGAQADLTIDTYPRKTVLFTRYRCRIHASELFWNRQAEIQGILDRQDLTPDGHFSAIFHDHYSNQFFFEEGDLEVFLPVRENAGGSPHIKEFGDFLRASRIHVGPYRGLLPVYVDLIRKISQQGYLRCGPALEEYMVGFSHGVREEQYVTRISFPVEPRTG